MLTVKQEPSSRASSRASSPSPREGPPSAPESSQSPTELCVPSFIQASDGGLLAGSSVLSGTVFGPYPGSLTKAPPRKTDAEEEIESTVLKIQAVSGQMYVIDVTQLESEHPWWASIKHTTEHSQANITLLSHDGALYLKTLKAIAKSEELWMIVTTPNEGGAAGQDVTTDAKSTPDKDATPMTTPLLHPTSTSLTKGPRFKCNFCCIEFRNPSNLDAHRVYYCPGTATKPLPSSRRRSAPVIQSATANAPAMKNAHALEVRCQAASAEKGAARETLKTLVCQLCQSSFESKSNCESHMLLLHCEESANLCKFCNFISRNRKGLCQHVFSHVREMVVDLPKGTGGGADKIGSSRGAELVRELLEGEGDEKENRYDVTAAGNSGNNPQNDAIQSASSPCIGRIVGSPSDRNNKHLASNLSSPENTLSHVKEERSGSAKLIRMESPNVHNVTTRTNLDPTEEDIVSCPQCDFVTSRESVLLKHVTHHDNLQEKTPDGTSSADIQAPKADKQQAVPNHLDTKCHQCNIVFMSKKNYAAHKQYYCASRHADSVSPVCNVDAKSATVSAVGSRNTNTVPTERIDHNAAMKNVNSPDESQGCSSKVVSPCSSPAEAVGGNSPRNSSLHRTPRVTMATSTPLVSPSTTRTSPHERPPWMIHVDDCRPHFPPPAKVLPGSQLVLITPIVIPQSLGNPSKLDAKLKVVTVRSSKIEQPLDLSTKPKTPPLSNLSGSDNHKGTKSSGLAFQITTARFHERQCYRCEECEISFSKNESLVVHKQYYCASRHIFTPRGLVRTKQYSAPQMPAFPRSQPQSKSPSPEQTFSRSPNTRVEAGCIATHNSQNNPKISERSSPSSGPSSVYQSSSLGHTDIPNPPKVDYTVPYTSPSHHSRSSPGAPTLSNGHSFSKQSSLTGTGSRDSINHHQPWSHSLKRATSNGSAESDREKSLPPIKRKRNLFVDGETRIPSTATPTNGQVTNGIIIKQEPKDFETGACPYTCNRPTGTLGHPPTNQSQHPTRKMPPRSSPSPKQRVRNSPTKVQTEAVIKQEPCDDDTPLTNGHSVAPPELHRGVDTSRHPADRPQQDAVLVSAGRTFPRGPPLVRHPTASATPLTIPVYRHVSSRQASSARHMTVSSYLNTGTSRPLLRGVKPTVKHCRNCNISFSSLSTFIAHKKYYCASHHQAKNAAT